MYQSIHYNITNANAQGIRVYASYNWLCAKSSFDANYGETPSCSSILDDPANFTISITATSTYNYSDLYVPKEETLIIDSCFSQTLEEQCIIEASLSLLGVVITFISCKLLCMLWVLWKLREHPLAVVGNAISSFVKKPDENTKGACLGNPSDFNHKTFWPSARKWPPKPRRWSCNASSGQWTTCVLL